MIKFLGAFAFGAVMVGALAVLSAKAIHADGCSASVTHIQTITVSHEGTKKIESVRQQIIEAKQGVCK